MKTHKPMIFVVLAVTLGAAVRLMAAPDSHAAIAAQSRAFSDAVECGDASAVAALFTLDAKLIVPGVEDPISGRSAIQDFWQAGLSNGVKGLRLTPIDVDGGDGMLIETGTYQALGVGGSAIGQGHYLFVWKKDKGVWRIHRDIASAKPDKTAANATRTATPNVSSHAAATAPVGAAADRVGFPRDYGSTLKLLGVTSQDHEPSVMTAYGNTLATAVVDGADRIQYPYGTVIAMEFAHGVRDGEGQLLYDAGGVLRKAEVNRIDVMRRERGYGEVYGKNRAGEWEFASYRPDGSTLLAPENASACAACHLKAGADRDFVFRRPATAAQR
jgi:uncharacterized protein (TIGR02246 family)